MEERNIFNDNYIHFKWDDSLEGKKGFFSDSACNFKDYIYNPTTKKNFYAEEIITKSLDNEEYPFEDPDGGQWKFVYYDPNYKTKIAWTNGNTIQYKDNDGVWHDLLSSKPEWGAIEYRVKPDKYEEVKMIDLNRASKIFFEIGKDKQSKYMKQGKSLFLDTGNMLTLGVKKLQDACKAYNNYLHDQDDHSDKTNMNIFGAKLATTIATILIICGREGIDIEDMLNRCYRENKEEQE